MDVEVLNRVANHAKTLKESGAPHQQELASDLATIVEHCQRRPAEQTAPDDRDEQIANLKDSVGKLMDERDAARKERDDALALLDEKTKATEGHGGAKNVAEEEHVQLKAKSK
jgi:hypothetical protein